MKITYLLGAGASYKAIPIIGELNDAFLEINSICQTNVSHYASSDVIKGKALFDSHMKTSAKAANIYGTIDTYAKKLSFTNPDDLKKVKSALALFFIFWQKINKDRLKKRINKSEDGVLFQDIDDRYFGLIANYLERKNEKIVLNDDINFITWNYDTQLERAISVFLDKNLENVLEEFAVFPWNIKNTPKINHLNGIAGLFKKNTDAKIITLFGNSNEKNIEKIFEELLPFMSDTEESKSENADYFSYAWEEDLISKMAVKRAIDTMKETEILVIIGYSFPTFNDSIDKVLFNELKKLKTVYYQDPNASEELLISRFNIDSKKIKIIKDTKQFILPLESQKPRDFIYS